MRLQIIFLVLLFNYMSCAQSPQEIQAGTGFAVVELFTSEGCSSCPSAEKALNDLIERAEKENIPIYGLAFHVNYWNYLGWDDRYSKAEYTQRQRNYAGSLGSSRVYTPQMVVNGKYEFVGSNRTLANKHIEEALNSKPNLSLTLMVESPANSNKALVKYQVSSESALKEPLILNVALVESGIHTDVKSGENRGRTLYHSNVVRDFQRLAIQSDLIGSISLDLPKDMDPAQCKIIAYLQQDKLGNILFANSADLD